MATKKPYKKGSKKKYRRDYKRNSDIKIGVFIYALIFIYLIINIIKVLNKNDIHYVVAETGSIYNSDTFKGVIVRDEVLIKNSKQGTITHFKKQGEKVKINDYICSIDQNGEFTNLLKKNLNFLESDIIDQADISSDKYNTIYKYLSGFSMQYEPSYFNELYTLKGQIMVSLDDISSEVLTTYDSELEVLLNNKELFLNQLKEHVHIIQAPKSGIISYNIDGYEEIGTDASYDTLKTVLSGKPLTQETNTEQEMQEEKLESDLFKIVNNRYWYILLEVNTACEKFIEDKSNLKLYFKNQKLSVDSRIIEVKNENDHCTLVLEIDRYLHKFLNERITEIVIDYNEYDGIKIPNASIVEKKFLMIPSEYVIQDSKSIMRKVYGEQYVGGESVEVLKIGLHYYKDNTYYVPIYEDGLKPNDSIVIPDSLNTYNVATVIPLQGVYVINKGYTAFKLIEPIHASKKYTIVKNRTPYGIRTYDRIVSDTENIDENTIIY